MMFAFGMLTQAAMSAAVLGCTSNLATKLAMVQTALDLGVSREVAVSFATTIAPRVRKVASRRNRIAHSTWTTHPDYPDDLIRVASLTNPDLGIERWSPRDFAELMLALAELQLQLRQFLKTLPQLVRRQRNQGQNDIGKLHCPIRRQRMIKVLQPNLIKDSRRDSQVAQIDDGTRGRA